MRFFIVVLGIFIFAYFFRPVETDDVWWHLSVGQWMVEHMQVPHQDPFPFGNEKTPWVWDEWLGSSVLYLVFKTGGLLGLKVFRSLVFVAGIGIFFFYARKCLPFFFSIILALLMALGISDRFFLRPDTFNLIFIQLCLMALFTYERTGDRRCLFVLPVLGVIWFNFHIGSFVYGLPLILIFLVSAIAKYFIAKVRKESALAIGEAKARIRDLALMMSAYLAGFLINPYGWQGFLFPFKVFLLPAFLDFYKISKTVTETQPSSYLFASFDYWHVFVLAALGLLLYGLGRTKNLTLIALWLFSACMLLIMVRNVVFFTVLSVYVIAEGARGMMFKEVWTNWRWSGIANSILAFALGMFFIIRLWNIYDSKIFYNDRLIKYYSLEASPFTAAAMAVLKENKIAGPVFNTDGLGGAILWEGYPGLRPFIDGRRVDKIRFKDSMLILQNPDRFWPIAEEYYHFNIVMLNTSHVLYANFINYFIRQTAWQLIAVEGNIAVYVKRGAFNLSNTLDQFQTRLMSIPIEPEDIKRFDALNKTKNSFAPADFLNSPPILVDAYVRGLTLLKLGCQGAGLQDLIQALAKTHHTGIQNVDTILLSY